MAVSYCNGSYAYSTKDLKGALGIKGLSLKNNAVISILLSWQIGEQVLLGFIVPLKRDGHFCLLFISRARKGFEFMCF